MNYRLVYKNNKVYALHYSSGTTETLKNLLYFDKLEDSFDKIDELKLEYTYLSGNTIEIIFSGGTRTIKDTKDMESPKVPDTPQ